MYYPPEALFFVCMCDFSNIWGAEQAAVGMAAASRDSGSPTTISSWAVKANRLSTGADEKESNKACLHRAEHAEAQPTVLGRNSDFTHRMMMFSSGLGLKYSWQVGEE